MILRDVFISAKASHSAEADVTEGRKRSPKGKNRKKSQLKTKWPVTCPKNILTGHRLT